MYTLSDRYGGTQSENGDDFAIKLHNFLQERRKEEFRVRRRRRRRITYTSIESFKLKSHPHPIYVRTTNHRII